MKQNTKTLIILLVAVLLLATIHYWLDVRVAWGNTHSENHVQAYSIGIERDQPKPVISQLTIYVEEPAYLLGSVRQAFVKGIQDTYGIPDLRVVYEKPEAGNGPVMHVQVKPRQLLWLVFFSRTSFDVWLAYAQDGDLAWVDDTVIEFSGTPAIRMKGDFKVVDSSWGLMTLRGQTRYLGRQVAAELLQAIDMHLM